MVANNFMPLDEPDEKQPASRSFAQCMKLVFEVDPLECPKCGEQMKIVAFVHDSREIEKIADNLGLTTWRAPPKFSPTGIHTDYSHKYAQPTF